MDHRVEIYRNIATVRWYDNKALALLFTQTCIEPNKTTNIWDKKRKQQVQVSISSIIADYNEYMGDMDMLDSFLANIANIFSYFGFSSQLH